jgi:hypothetical protein
MNQSANLEARVRALELEYARLTERMRTVGAALGGAEPAIARAAPLEARASTPEPVGQSGKQAESALRTASPRHQQQAKAQPPAAGKSTGPTTSRPSPSTKKTVRGAQAGAPRKWFEKGEALELFRKILKKPMRTRDLMVRVVAAKRMTQLPKKDLERFKWAVHSALKEAVGANAIVRQGEGMIAFASGNARAAGKAPSKAKK